MKFGNVVALLILAAALATAALLERTRLGSMLHARFPDRPRRRLLLAAVGFFITFGGVRALTWSIHHNVGPFHDVQMGGRHIHHLVWGILLLLAVGYGWLIDVGTGQGRGSVLASRLMSFLYGAAAALTLDEFALWLNLRDVYWGPEGRASISAAFLFGSLLALGAFVAPVVHGLVLHRRRGRKRPGPPRSG